MATKVKITKTGFKKLNKKLKTLSKPIDKRTAQKIGRTTIREMLSMIASGKSPIQGRRFAKYKKSYVARIKAGRGLFAGKSVTPVNLRLSGKFLKDLKFSVRKGPNGWSTLIGYFTKLSKAKEEGHREGANKQRKRPTIPVGNERFDTKINQKVKKILDQRIKKIL